MKKYAHNALVTFPKVPHVHIKLLIIDEFWNTCGKGPSRMHINYLYCTTNRS